MSEVVVSASTKVRTRRILSRTLTRGRSLSEGPQQRRDLADGDGVLCPLQRDQRRNSNEEVSSEREWQRGQEYSRLKQSGRRLRWGRWIGKPWCGGTERLDSLGYADL